VPHDADLARRLDALAELLPILAEALDVRTVIPHILRVTRKVLPHDTIGVALIGDDRRSVRIHALSSDVGFTPPEEFPVNDEGRALLDGPWDYLLVDDMQLDPVMRTLPPVQGGLRSSLRIPIRRDGQLVGGVNFMAAHVGAFSEADVPVAQRVAAYIDLALSHQRLADAAARAAEARERAAVLERRVEVLQEELVTLGRLPRRIVGEAPAWRRVMSEATKVAPTETTVLIAGASGTGKEVVARYIHGASPRAAGPFVALNCAAIPDALIESELFGTERGAYTGAAQARAGHVERAAGGVLFLDEVGELSPGAQAKLLRVLQEREFLRLGGTRPRQADVRIVAATNADLATLVREGRFREDLFYRLNIFAIDLPLLCERREDIIALSLAFLEDIGRQLARPAAGLSREARPVLLEYPWPGNVRELRNVLERASILAEGGLITSDHLLLHALADTPPRTVPRTPSREAPDPAPPQALADLERQMVADALRAVRFNKTRAAARLGLTRSQLYVRLRRYGLDRDGVS
jgi:transcriptional regulator with GAF, ATPase, and Fis domain